MIFTTVEYVLDGNPHDHYYSGVVQIVPRVGDNVTISDAIANRRLFLRVERVTWGLLVENSHRILRDDQTVLIACSIISESPYCDDPT